MPSKPETTYIQRIHRKIDRFYDDIYHEKTNNPYRRGIPDVYYESWKGIMWVEYKHRVAINGHFRVDDFGKKGNLTKHQATWLERAYDNGRSVAVIIGTKVGAYVFQGMSWQGIHDTENLARPLSDEGVAGWIAYRIS